MYQELCLDGSGIPNAPEASFSFSCSGRWGSPHMAPNCVTHIVLLSGFLEP